MIATPLLLVWAGALAIIFLDGRRRLVALSGCAVLVATLLLSVRVGSQLVATGSMEITTGGWPAGVGITLRVDALGLTFALLSVCVLTVSLLVYTFTDRRSRRFPGLVLFMATALLGISFTGDLFNFYVFFEVALASAFAMVAEADEPREIRAALLFVVLNVIGSVLFLMAIAILYRLTGTLELRALTAALSASDAPRATGAGALLLAAFGLKLGLFPFHTWVPDVYRAMRPEVSAVFAGGLANIGSYGLLRFGGTIMAAELDRAGSVVLALAVASILYGGLAAVGARSTRGVLAYSAVGQAGYIMAAVALGGVAALTAAVVYAVVNSLNKTLLFLASGLRGPMAGAAFAAGAFSLAGLPPFAGFAAKAAIFRGGIDSGAWFVVAGLLAGSALTFIYIFPAYQREFWASGDRRPSPLPPRALLIAMAGALVYAGIWPGPLVRWGTLVATAMEASR